MFRENGIDFEKVNYYVDPLSESKLKALIKKAGLRPIDVVRKKELKELRLSEDASDDQLLKAMVKNPDLLQRPMVEVGDKAVLARPAEKALELIK